MVMGKNFAELPEEIIQHIQSFLDLKQGTQTILLSKSWLRAWYTRPFLHFNFWGAPDYVINSTLARYLEQGIPILKFSLFYPYRINEIWLQIMQQNNLLELDLDLSVCNITFQTASSFWYQIFRSNSLLVLKLVMKLEFKLALTLSDIKCRNLKALELSYINFDYLTYQHIIFSCPLIENLLLTHCRLSELEFRTADLPNIKVIKLVSPHMKSVDISDAPKLHSLTLIGEIKLIIGHCSSLKRLTLSWSGIKDEGLQSILYKNPQLEDLTIDNCYELIKMIDLSGLSSLKCFKLGRFMKQVIIDAPSLHRLKFISLAANAFPITSPRRMEKVNVSIVYKNSQIDASWFHGLREFLMMFPKSNLQLNLGYVLTCSFNEIRANPPSPQFQVEVLTIKRRCLHLQSLYALFSVCHPKTVFFRDLDKTMNSESLIKLCKDLISCRGYLDCCKRVQNKCWRHFIKDAKFYHLSGQEKKLIQMNELGTEHDWRVTSLALDWK